VGISVVEPEPFGIMIFGSDYGGEIVVVITSSLGVEVIGNNIELTILDVEVKTHLSLSHGEDFSVLFLRGIDGNLINTYPRSLGG